MATNYTILGYTQTSETQGANRVIPVREYHVVTHPHEIYFQFRRPKGKWEPANIASVADQLATRIELVRVGSLVTDLTYWQDVTQGGMLKDMFTVYYSAYFDQVQGSIDVPMAELGPVDTPPLVDDAAREAGELLGL